MEQGKATIVLETLGILNEIYMSDCVPIKLKYFLMMTEVKRRVSHHLQQRFKRRTLRNVCEEKNATVLTGAVHPRANSSLLVDVSALTDRDVAVLADSELTTLLIGNIDQPPPSPIPQEGDRHLVGMSFVNMFSI